MPEAAHRPRCTLDSHCHSYEACASSLVQQGLSLSQLPPPAAPTEEQGGSLWPVTVATLDPGHAPPQGYLPGAAASARVCLGDTL